MTDATNNKIGSTKEVPHERVAVKLNFPPQMKIMPNENYPLSVHVMVNRFRKLRNDVHNTLILTFSRKICDFLNYLMLSDK